MLASELAVGVGDADSSVQLSDFQLPIGIDAVAVGTLLSPPSEFPISVKEYPLGKPFE
jgi:hypothetical protein